MIELSTEFGFGSFSRSKCRMGAFATRSADWLQLQRGIAMSSSHSDKFRNSALAERFFKCCQQLGRWREISSRSQAWVAESAGVCRSMISKMESIGLSKSLQEAMASPYRNLFPPDGDVTSTSFKFMEWMERQAALGYDLLDSTSLEALEGLEGELRYAKAFGWRVKQYSERWLADAVDSDSSNFCLEPLRALLFEACRINLGVKYRGAVLANALLAVLTTVDKKAISLRLSHEEIVALRNDLTELMRLLASSELSQSALSRQEWGRAMGYGAVARLWLDSLADPRGATCTAAASLETLRVALGEPHEFEVGHWSNALCVAEHLLSSGHPFGKEVVGTLKSFASCPNLHQQNLLAGLKEVEAPELKATWGRQFLNWLAAAAGVSVLLFALTGISWHVSAKVKSASTRSDASQFTGHATPESVAARGVISIGGGRTA